MFYFKSIVSILFIALFFSGCFGWGQMKPKKYKTELNVSTSLEFKA